MNKTIAQTVIDYMTTNDYIYIGMTTGQLSFRKNSNLSRYLAARNLTPTQVKVKIGAKKQRRSEGYQLLVFVRGE